MVTLDTSLKELSPIARVLEKKLKKLEIETIGDLIFYYPFRYDDFSQILSIEKLKSGEVVTIKGKIELIANRRSHLKRKILTEALASDETGSIRVIWFNQPFLTRVLQVGDWVYFAGRVEEDFGAFQLVSPSYEKIPKLKRSGTTHTARIVPIYSLISGLTQKQLRFLIKLALGRVGLVRDWLPWEIKKSLKLLELPQALRQIHFPQDKNKLAQARFRLKFDELFLIQLEAFFLKKELQKNQAPAIIFEEKETKKFVDSLPFKLTRDQKIASWEIIQDLGKPHPMNRLLEGDVGSGKTVVVLMGILNVVLNNYQVAYMAPTEILARQHFETFLKLLKSFPQISISLLTRSAREIKEKRQRGGSSSIKKEKLLAKIAKGEVAIIIGTHALIEEKVSFKRLALAIIDEQHRFGVGERQALKKQSGRGEIFPHLLTLTATPIPRTLALTLYGDLDLSLIRELPPGRKKVITKIVEPEKRFKAYEFIKSEIARGRQVFVICPLIDPSDKLGVKAVTTEYEKLDKEIFPDLKIGWLHGRLKTQEKREIMDDFLANKIKILVATSVVEVGIDIPNASIMMIEGAERFGLAQLHQFRGRVGRAKHQSYCFLFTEVMSEKTEKRLESLVKSENGFELAEKDLELRGPGEIYGLRQSGLPDLKIASLTDYSLIKEARFRAQELLRKDPDLVNHPLVKEKLKELVEVVHLE